MGTLPEVVEKVGLEGTNYYTADIVMDANVVGVLRKI
jgi:hypothetical protein